jgi:hypothetical protein
VISTLSYASLTTARSRPHNDLAESDIIICIKYRIIFINTLFTAADYLHTEDLFECFSSPSVIISQSTSRVTFCVSDSRLSLLYCTTSAKLPDKFSNKLATSSGSSFSGSHKLNNKDSEYNKTYREQLNQVKFFFPAVNSREHLFNFQPARFSQD